MIHIFFTETFVILTKFSLVALTTSGQSETKISSKWWHARFGVCGIETAHLVLHIPKIYAMFGLHYTILLSGYSEALKTHAKLKTYYSYKRTPIVLCAFTHSSSGAYVSTNQAAAGNGLVPGGRQAIIWTNIRFQLDFLEHIWNSEIRIKMHIFSSKKIHWKCHVKNIGKYGMKLLIHSQLQRLHRWSLGMNK